MFATGATKPGDYSKELARPALDSVSKLAERAKAERERDSLRAQLAAAERVIEAYNHVSQNILDSAVRQTCRRQARTRHTERKGVRHEPRQLCRDILWVLVMIQNVTIPRSCLFTERAQEER